MPAGAVPHRSTLWYQRRIDGFGRLLRCAPWLGAVVDCAFDSGLWLHFDDDIASVFWQIRAARR
jgi:hypothetical protein